MPEAVHPHAFLRRKVREELPHPPPLHALGEVAARAAQQVTVRRGAVLLRVPLDHLPDRSRQRNLPELPRLAVLQLRRFVRVGMDLLPHPVHVLRHDVVDVHRPRLAVAQTAPRHHRDLQCEILIGDRQCLLHVTEGWNGHLLAHVFRLLDPLHRIVRHGSLVVRVPQDGLENPEDVHLVPRPTPSFSISSRKRSTTVGVTEFSFRAPRRGTMWTLIELSACSPVE